MARTKSANLTDVELRLMEVVWTKGEASVSDVVEGVQSDPPPAYSTVLTMLRILEKKGYLVHRKEGRAFLYKPAVGRDAAKESALRHLLGRFFQDSPELLLLNLLDSKKISAAELARLKKRIAEVEE